MRRHARVVGRRVVAAASVPGLRIAGVRIAHRDPGHAAVRATDRGARVPARAARAAHPVEPRRTVQAVDRDLRVRARRRVDPTDRARKVTGHPKSGDHDPPTVAAPAADPVGGGWIGAMLREVQIDPGPEAVRGRIRPDPSHRPIPRSRSRDF